MKTKFSGILTLLLAFVVQFTFAQEKTISGTVSDVSGLPLPGVNILVKGTTSGSQTDFDGKYSLKANSGDVLSFSYLGLKAKEVTVGASNTVNVTMEEDTAVLDEVVVTALGIKREKRELVYQTETVNNEQLLVTQPTTAASALTGKVAGLQINNQNNGVKPSSQILLRGLRSISGGNTALIVIDGSISTQGAFDALNPNDIEDLNILKGATAAVLYGSNASNGAVLVTTKKGNKGKRFSVGLTSTTTFEEVAYMPEFQTQYGIGWQGVYDAIENTNWGPRFDGTIRQVGPTFADGSFQSLAYAPVKNGARDFYETGTTFQNTAYFSGSSDDSDFYVSIGDQKTTGIVYDDRYKKNTFRMNASKKMGNVTLALTSNYFRDQTNTVGSTIGGQNRPLYWFILNTPANIPLSNYKNWRTDLFASPDGYYNGYYQNPYWGVDTNRNNDKSDRFNGNVSASWDALSWLNLTARLGLNNATSFNKNFRATQTYTDAYTRPDAVSSFVTDYESQSLQYTTDFLATGTFELSEAFSLKTIVGATNYTTKFRESAITANNLSIPGFYDVSNGTGQIQGGLAGGVFVRESYKRSYGFFSDVTLGFKRFLYLNVSGRYDFVSTLAPANNSYFYPGFGLSFVLSDAFPAIKSDVFNYAKLTVNNSTVYNDLGPFAINERYQQSSSFPYGNINGFFLGGTTVDANIKKEKVNTTEVGLNMNFFKNRVTLSAAYFKTFTNDLITNTTPATSSGASSFLTNIGELEGTGYEVSIGATVLKANDFEWDINVNYSANETIVNEITDDVSQVVIQPLTDAGIYAVVGEAFPQIKASSYVRDPNGNIVIDANTGNPVIGALKSLGKTTPDYVVGLTSAMKYKGFTLTATFDYRTGHVYYSQLADAMEFTGRSMESVSSNRQDFIVPNSVINTGTAANPVYVPNTNIPVTGGRQSYWTDHYNNIKENYVYDATAVKIRELALNYSIPSRFLEKSMVSKVSFGLVARNLLTWLPAQNRFSDPEFNNTNSNAIGVGGYFQSPPTRTFGVSLNVEL